MITPRGALPDKMSRSVFVFVCPSFLSRGETGGPIEATTVYIMAYLSTLKAQKILGGCGCARPINNSSISGYR